jgi:hypothetical protein
MKPLIPTRPELLAIIASNLTQIRREIKPQPISDFDSGYVYFGKHQFDIHGMPYSVELPKYSPFPTRTILYVRETWGFQPDVYFPGCELPDNGYYIYKVDGTELHYTASGWHSPVTMPREAARFFLEVTGVRVEQVDGVWQWVYDVKQVEKPKI